jgi:GntR family transcriptional regulator / MocR family aminotransferase
MKRRHPRTARQWTSLDRQGRAPLYRQIYERFRNAIASGILQPGERLPSARSLASQLATARGTVDAAYDLLVSEGYIVCRGAAGTIVSPTLADVLHQRRQSFQTADARKNLRNTSVAAAGSSPGSFQMGLPALDAFPRSVWSRLAVKRARNLSSDAMTYQNPFGYEPLREAIASYLALARGISCSSEKIIITAGFQGAMGLITRTLLAPGDEVWVEDPGYPHARRALTAAGASLVPVPVDSQGMDVAAGIVKSPRARLAVVTPSHQAPLGVALDLPRRLSLLAWADKVDARIVEDDYDGEFRYNSKPLPALKSLDRSDRVLYVGTFSKVLFPGLRLGYMVLPDSLVDAFERVLDTLYRDSSTFIPSVVADFMTEGHFARHVKRMRQLYAERRAALAAALDEVFADRFDVKLQAGGMHLLAYLRHHERDVTVAQRANSHGLAVSALSRWSVKNDCGQALLLSFTNIPEELALREAKRLEQAIKY